MPVDLAISKVLVLAILLTLPNRRPVQRILLPPLSARDLLLWQAGIVFRHQSLLRKGRERLRFRAEFRLVTRSRFGACSGLANSCCSGTRTVRPTRKGSSERKLGASPRASLRRLLLDHEAIYERFQGRRGRADDGAVGFESGPIPQQVRGPRDIPAVVEDVDVLDHACQTGEADEEAQAEDGIHEMFLQLRDLQAAHDVAREDCSDEVRDDGDGGHDGPKDAVVDASVGRCVVGAVGEPEGVKGPAVEENNEGDGEGGGGLEDNGRFDDAKEGFAVRADNEAAVEEEDGEFGERS